MRWVAFGVAVYYICLFLGCGNLCFYVYLLCSVWWWASCVLYPDNCVCIYEIARHMWSLSLIFICMCLLYRRVFSVRPGLSPPPIYVRVLLERFKKKIGISTSGSWSRRSSSVSVTKCNRVLFTRIDDKAAWGSTPMSGGGPDPSCFEYL